MLTRAGRATIFDRKAFTEAFFDDDAMADSAIIVALVGGATYLGFLARGVFLGFELTEFLGVVLYSVVSWLILGFATWFAATRIFQASGRPQALIALQGLAVLPLLAEIFGSPISWVGLVWYLVILVVATKEATDLPYKHSGVSVLIGFAVTFLIRLLLGAPFALLGGALG